MRSRAVSSGAIHGIDGQSPGRPGALKHPELAAEVTDRVGRATFRARTKNGRDENRSPDTCEDQQYHNAQRSSTYFP